VEPPAAAEPAPLHAAGVLPRCRGAFDELGSADALAVLAIAPTPTLGRRLSQSKIAAALRRAGRQRRVEERTVEIQQALRAPQLEAPTVIADAMGASARALVAVIVEFVAGHGRHSSLLAIAGWKSRATARRRIGDWYPNLDIVQ
jgi:hypothetical protein